MSFLEKIKNILPVTRGTLIRKVSRLNKKQTKAFDKRFEQLSRKLSMQDDIWQVNNVKFYVPNYPADFIQSVIVDENAFYEQGVLDDLAQYLPESAVICDIGTNIGNHTLYWLKVQRVRFVYCFEPRPETYRILEKNIVLNNLTNSTKCFNIALSDKYAKLSTRLFNNNNIGGNAYREDVGGDIESTPLDDIVINDKIDFMKIDVEGMEGAVLKGAQKRIQQDKPLIFIETFADNYEQIHEALANMGYALKKKYPYSNYLYAPL